MSKHELVPVNRRSTIRRIGQRLPEGQALKATRGGDWFIIDTVRGSVVDRDPELEALARRVSALEPWERLETE